MGILYMTTADMRDVSHVATGTVSLPSISSSYKRTGTYSYKMGSFTSMYLPYFSEKQTAYARLCYYPVETSHVGSTTLIEFKRSGDNNPQMGLNILFPDGAILLKQKETTVATLTGISFTSFLCLEFYYYGHASSGVFQVKLNGDLIFNYAGDTLPNGGTGVDQIKLYQYNYGDTYWDDIILRDDQWPGRGGIHVLIPNGGTATENWTASAGDPEACVDEAPPSFADYIYTDASVDGTQQLFETASLPITSPEAIHAVGVCAKAKTDVAGTAFLQTLLKSGTTVSKGDSTGVEVGGGWFNTYYTQDPDTSAAWSESGVNALQIGVESDVP